MNNDEVSSCLSNSKINNISKNIEAKDISEIPKCAANTKSDCPHITDAAPIKPCNTKKKTDKNDNNITSRIFPIYFQDKYAKARTDIPTIPETNLCLSSITSSVVISEGINCP